MQRFLSVILACALTIGGSIAVVASEPQTNSPAASIAEALGDKYTLEDLMETRAPAPPLTDIRVLLVSSEQAGDETIRANQTTTSLDHGGSWIQVVTYEEGYASSRKATFNGYSMDLTDFQLVDTDGDRIGDGFQCLWTDKSSFTSGQFMSEATSSNYPWNTMQTRINVK